MKLINILYLLLSFFVLFSCSNSADSTKKKEKKKVHYLTYFDAPPGEEMRKLRYYSKEFYNKFIVGTRFSGQFLVAKKGHVVYTRHNGYTYEEKDWKTTKHTPIHVASISKVATALCVLRLADQHKINLDAKVKVYLKNFPYANIRVRDLLTHRSGLPYYGYFMDHIWDRKVHATNKDVLAMLIKHNIALNFKPNTRFTYCNTNFAMLALIVEEVTKQEFPIAMNELIFKPLKMQNSFIMNLKKDPEAVAQSYKQNGIRFAFDFLDAIYGDKNLYTTAYDIMRMDQGTYNKNFLSDSLRKQMYRGYSYEHPGKSNYGLGTRMKEEKGRDTYFFHTAWWHGSTGCYASLRADTICVVALSNVFDKSVYGINRLAERFGNYPFDFVPGE